MEKLNDKKTTILATCFDDVKINPYQVKTKGKHPIRWFDGGISLEVLEASVEQKQVEWVIVNYINKQVMQ